MIKATTVTAITNTVMPSLVLMSSRMAPGHLISTFVLVVYAGKGNRAAGLSFDVSALYTAAL